MGVLKEDTVEKARDKYLEFTNTFVQKTNSRYDQCNLVIATECMKSWRMTGRCSSMMDNANEARKQCKIQKVDSAVEIYTRRSRKNLENTRDRIWYGSCI